MAIGKEILRTYVGLTWHCCGQPAAWNSIVVKVDRDLVDKWYKLHVEHEKKENNMGFFEIKFWRSKFVCLKNLISTGLANAKATFRPTRQFFLAEKITIYFNVPQNNPKHARNTFDYSIYACLKDNWMSLVTCDPRIIASFSKNSVRWLVRLKLPVSHLPGGT